MGGPNIPNQPGLFCCIFFFWVGNRMFSGNHSWYQSSISHGDSNTMWCRNRLPFRGWISVHLTFSSWMERTLLVEGGGCMYRAVWFCLSPQNLGCQSMAVPKRRRVFAFDCFGGTALLSQWSKGAVGNIEASPRAKLQPVYMLKC